MENLRPRLLKSQAADALRGAAYNPHKLAVIHASAGAVLSLSLYAITFWLDHQIGQTGGLSGLGNRALLETVQMVLMYANMILLPFWELGFLRAAMDLTRGQDATPHTLLAGFRRFGTLLLGKIMLVLVLMGAMFAGSYVGVLVFSMTPLAENLYTLMEPYATTLTPDYAAMLADEALLDAMLPCLPFALITMAILALPVYYRLRMMDYVLLDDEKMGAFQGFRFSMTITRRKCLRLLRLDLSFWWFYLLQIFVSVVCYGDVLLPMLGVDLGMSADVALFVFYAAALILQIGLFAWAKPQVMATYARFYDELLPKEQEDTQETTEV